MNTDIIITLIQNIAILLAMVFIYSQILSNRDTSNLYYRIAIGVFNGLVGILLMWTALHLDNGVIFDTRSILISVSGMFFGIVPTLISAIIMVIYRISLGGPGMIVGVAVVITTSIIGIGAHRYLLPQILTNIKASGLKIYLFGIVVHIDMLLCMFMLQRELRWGTLTSISLPVIILYPIGTYLLCKVLLAQIDMHHLLHKIAVSEEKYRTIAENTSDMIWTMDISFRLTYVSPSCIRLFGESEVDYIAKPHSERILPKDRANLMNFLQNVLHGQGENQKSGGTPQIHECRHMLLDGDYKWISISANTILDDKGNVIGLTGTVRDINQLKRIEIENNRQTALMISIIDSIPDIIFYKDAKGVYQGGNLAFAEFCGRPKDEIIGINDNDIFPAEMADRFRFDDNLMLRRKTLLRKEELVTSVDGSIRIYETMKTPYWTADGTLAGIIGISRDITERKQKEDEIQYVAFHDYLTGLYNRRFYEEELHRLDVPRNLPMTVVMGDVNGLKMVNDSFGHASGDLFLQKAAQMIKENCRNDDIIARFGGDEFIILLPNTTSDETEIILERIHKSLSKEYIKGVELSVSFGRHTKTNENESIELIAKNAEDNMYRNKLLSGASIRSKTVDIIMNTLYEKNNREMLHSKRVSAICEKIAIQMSLDRDTIEQLKVAGLVHDIGKIGIEENILNSPNKLTDEQWLEMKKHSEIGYRILSGSEEFSEIAKFVLEHQGKWDGTGYPRGLSGLDISLEARVIALADAFDAMTRPRTYGRVYAIKEALEEIKGCAGSHFDPSIANMFVEHYTEMFG